MNYCGQHRSLINVAADNSWLGVQELRQEKEEGGVGIGGRVQGNVKGVMMEE